MSELIYDFDYSEEKQKEIIKKMERYAPLLENLISSFYSDLKFSVECSLSHKVNLFAGYYEPKVEIIAENLVEHFGYSSNNNDTTFKINDTESFLCLNEFCESIYSYLPDVLYNTSLRIKNSKGDDFECDFEEYALRKEVLLRYN